MICPKTAYVVFTDPDNAVACELVLADQNPLGGQKLALAYPKARLILSAEELAEILHSFGKREPIQAASDEELAFHFGLVVVEQGVPRLRCLVRANDWGQALTAASKLHPGCTFAIVGVIEHMLGALRELNHVIASSGPSSLVDYRNPSTRIQA